MSDNRLVQDQRLLPALAERWGGGDIVQGYRLLIELLPLAMYTCDAPSGAISYYNRRAAELWGREPVIGNGAESFSGAYRLFRPDGRSLAQAETPMSAVLTQSIEVHNEEIVIERPDGSRVVVMINIDPIRNAAGEVMGAIAIMQDVSERKRLEQRVAVEHAITRSLSESQTLAEAGSKVLQSICECLEWQFGALWILDDEIQALRCAQLWHVPTKDFPEFAAVSRRRSFSMGIGLPGRIWKSQAATWISDVVEDPNFPRAPVARQEDLHGAFGFPIKSATGFLGVMEFFSHEIREPDAGLLAMMEAIGSEIGLFMERKRTENELFKLNLELEKRVAERTAALERAHLALLQDVEDRRKLEEQLRQAQKLESIGTLAGGIAHDFNNILNLILGYTLLIQRSAGDPRKLGQSVEVIKDTVKRGSSLVQQLLSIVRKTELSFEQVDINSLLEKLQVLLRETFPRTIDVSLELKPGLPAIMADINQLHQVILNLCVNARDAMADGGKLVLATGFASSSKLCERFQDAKDHDYAWIRVADTGTGMDETTRSRIFEPFFSTKEPGHGTGLGLAVVYGIVRSHSGFVDVESEPGRGTTFHVYFPIPRQFAAEFDPVEEQQEPGEEGSGSTAVAETILFVEDEPRQLALMQTFLEGEGYRVLGARDGAEAVDVFLRHKHKIAVAVLDIGLPKMNGWEAFLKMKERAAELKTIFATGYISPEIEAGMASGEISGLIMKPYQLEDVLAKISAALRKPAVVMPDGGAGNKEPSGKLSKPA